MNKTVLIVEDDQKLLDALSFELEEQGYKVICRENGADCQSLVEKESINLVLADIFMPESDGIEILTTLRKSHPDVPIILMTGGSRMTTMHFDTILAQAEVLGAREVLHKPFKMEELSLSMAKHLQP